VVLRDRLPYRLLRFLAPQRFVLASGASGLYLCASEKKSLGFPVKA
jgi:hypothetical protein